MSSKEKNQNREIVCKVVVVGDGAVGKTCIMAVYQKNEFPAKYVPTVFENYTSQITIGEKKISLGLWDTAGQEDYDKLRPLSYPGTDCFVLCFSLVDPVSLDNVKQKWIPEIKKETGGQCKYILCGTKMDLREDKKVLETLQAKGTKPITKEEGEKFATENGCKGYVECSALQNQGIKQTFDKAIKIAIFDKSEPQTTKPSICNLL